MSRPIVKTVVVAGIVASISAVVLAVTPILTILSKNEFRLPFEGYYPPVIDTAYVANNILSGWIWSFLCFFPILLIVLTAFHFLKRLLVKPASSPEGNPQAKFLKTFRIFSLSAFLLSILSSSFFLYALTQNNNQGEIFLSDEAVNIDYGYLAILFSIWFSGVYIGAIFVLGIGWWCLRNILTVDRA